MKTPIILVAAMAAGCTTQDPMTDEQVNDVAAACIQAGGLPQVRYTDNGRYDYRGPIEVRCIVIGVRP